MINIVGLALGLTCFILITLYITGELSYDRHHPDAERIYRVINDADFGGVGETSTSSPFPLGTTMAQEYPNMIEAMTRIYNNWNTEYFVEYGEHHFKEKNFFFADSSIFKVFDIELVKGNPNTSLVEMNTVLITESAANRYFGDNDPVGKMIRLDERFHFKITGLLKDPPSNTHFHYDFLASMSTMRAMYGLRLNKNWIWNPYWTYIKLHENIDPEALKAQFPTFVDKYFARGENNSKTLYLQALTDIHLHSALDYEIETNGRMSYVIILAAIAIFMLIIASINFMNLATATSAGRAREIGVKKVFGAYRMQLIVQFIGESLIISFIALIIALVCVEIILPSFNNFAGKNISMSALLDARYLLGLIAVWLTTGILSGLYPAFYLSRFRPVKVLKGTLKNGAKSSNARKILVTVQFTISIALVIGTLMAFRQLNYLRNADLGFKKDNIIFIPVDHTPVSGNYDAFEGELLQNPKITHVTSLDYVLGVDHNSHEFKPEGFPDDEWQFYPTLIVREDFLKLFEIPVLEGRDFNRKNKTDSAKAILINEAMVKHMGWNSNREAIGKKFHSRVGQERVVGVFKNFNVKSLHSDLTPLVLNIKELEWERRYFTDYVVVCYTGEDPKVILSYIEDVWRKFSPTRPFDYKFLDTELEKLYRDEEKLGTLSAILAIVIIVVAAMGLFGLVSFMTEQRTKEIGIRKALGASIERIVGLISKEFVWLVIIANAVAWPLAWWMMSDWLQNFAYRTSINWLLFPLAGMITMMIAMSITGYRAWVASKTDPAKTLRYE
ncbi:MAG: ABC transporter permease [Bacteroidales bacterium]|nr:ABC transporter permease [Bacteroidales bacterium]